MTAEAPIRSSPHRRVALICDRIPHLGAYSGYRSIVPHLEQLGGCELLQSPAITSFVHPAINRLVRPRGAAWYQLASLGRELSAITRLLQRPPWICHLLDGEGAYHYSGRLRGFLGMPGKIVCTFHQPPSVFDRVIGERTPLARLDAAVVLCGEQAAHLRGQMEASRIHLIPHHVDTVFFHPPADAGCRSSRRFLCVGWWLRDHDMLAVVASRLLLEDPGIELVVVTPRVNAQALTEFSNVRIVQHLTDVQLLTAYQTATALVLPLTASTANNSLLEAMACGLPVIATNVGGVCEYVSQDGAILVEPSDAEAMYEAIMRLSCDQQQCRALGVHARARSLELRPAVAAEALIALYDQLAAER